MPLNITSANAVIVLKCDGLYPAGVELQNFSTDQSVSLADADIAVTRMGVDGHMAAGWIPSIKSVTIALEGSSPSAEVFDTIYKASTTNRTIYKIDLFVTLPENGTTRVFKDGVLKSWKIMGDLKQVQDPRNAVIDFEYVE